MSNEWDGSPSVNELARVRAMRKGAVRSQVAVDESQQQELTVKTLGVT